MFPTEPKAWTRQRRIGSPFRNATIADKESLRVNWLEGGATVVFGGTYAIAEYAGGDLSGLSRTFSAGSNIGGAYVEPTGQLGHPAGLRSPGAPASKSASFPSRAPCWCSSPTWTDC